MKIPNRVKEIIGKDQLVLVATSDKAGTPHLAAAKGLILMGDKRVAFRNWFCLQTLKNITENPKIALSFFGPDGEHGFQLIGRVEKSATTDIMDGSMSEGEQEGGDIPQAKIQMRINARKILEFSTGPHSDEMELSSEDQEDT